MIRRIAFWPVFAALAALFAYGLGSQRLFDQQVWASAGLVRLALFGGACGAWVLAVLLPRPGWLVRGTLAVALIGCVILAGPQAPLAVLLLFASAWALGTLFALEGALALLVGLSLYSFLIGFAVHLPMNYAAVYVAVFALPLGWQRGRLLSSARQVSHRLRKAEGICKKSLAAAVLLGFIMLMHLVVALGPEVSADGLAMHMAIPASVQAHHKWTFDPEHTTWAVIPMAGDWEFTAAYMLGGEAAARLFNYGLLLSIAGMVFALARRLVAEHLSLLLAALFASSPMVQLVTGSLFVENFWAATLMGAIAALARYAECGEKRYALAAAVLLGTGLAAKFGAFAYLAPALILLGWEVRLRRAIRLVPAIAALVLLFGSPPYLGALVQTGNPVYPFLNHIFKSPYFESGKPFQETRFPPPPAASALFDLTFRTQRHFEGQNGGWTFLCFLFAPLAALLVRPRRGDPGWLALAVALPASVLTLGSQGNVRYLYPALAPCAVAAAAVIREVEKRGSGSFRAVLGAAVAVLVLNIYFMPASGGYHKQFFVLGKDQVNRYLAVWAPGRGIVAWLNQAHRGEPAVFVDTNQIAGLIGRAFTTTWHNAAFHARITAAGSAGECLEEIERLGIRHVVAPADPNTIVHVALRRMVTDSTDPEFTHAGWQVRRLREGRRTIPAKAAKLARGVLDDLDPRIEYSGRWDSARFREAASGSVTYSNYPGDLFRVAFEGTGVTWVYTKAFNRGRAEVRIDGIRVGVVDLYSREPVWRARSSYRNLAAGPHVLEVRALGTKDPAATDCFIDVDEVIAE